MQRKCLECNESFSGRVDKKFCSDSCRNNYNNRQNSDTTNYVRNINNALRKNRRILEELSPNGKTKVHKEKLNYKGFDFNYFTHIYTNKEKKVYYFCYEYGYLPLENDFYFLVKRDKERD